MNKDGSGFGVLHSFSDAGDGADPEAALLEGSDGTLYGTTVLGGSHGDGTIFKLEKDGSSYRILHHFNDLADGIASYATLVEGRDGALYGTTAAGGSKSAGTIFKLDKDGSHYSLLHQFSGSDGARPQAGLSSCPARRRTTAALTCAS